MRTAATMTTLVTAIAEKHNLDLAAPGACLVLVHAHDTRLVITRVGPNQVSVAYFPSNASPADPEIVLFAGDPYGAEWAPIEMVQVTAGIDVMAASITPDGQSIAKVRTKTQADITRAAEALSVRLEAEKWLEAAEKMNTTG